MNITKTISNKNIPDFLDAVAAQKWTRYFAKELDAEIGFEFFYDAQVNIKYPATDANHVMRPYKWMGGYYFGLTPHCLKDIESSILKDRRLTFYLKKKGRQFLYIVLFKKKESISLIPGELCMTLEPYYQYSIFDYIN